MLLLLLIFAGFITAFTPGIIPLLPMVIAKDKESKKQHMIGLFVGFIVSFTLCTSLFVLFVQAISLPPLILRYAALAFIALFGLIMMSRFLYTKCTTFVTKIADWGMTLYSKDSSFSKTCGSLIAGAILGLTWIPFTSPLLTALVALTSHNFFSWEALYIITLFGFGTSTGLMFSSYFFTKYAASPSLTLSKYKQPLIRLCGLIVFILAVSCMFNQKPTFLERYLIKEAK